MKILQNLDSSRFVKRSVTILGSTGSIGCSTLDLVNYAPEHFEVIAITGNKNVKLLIEQARIFEPKLAVIGDEDLYGELKEGLQETKVKAGAGISGLCEAADLSSDIVIAGIVGIAGLEPTLTAVKRGCIIGLANKECLVCSGGVFLDEIEQSGATLIPIDSEHNAIFQVFNFNQVESVEKLTLTASGGPFIKTSYVDMGKVTPAQATKHPNWDMGAKISVDSATMMNKGLELIEAFYLFPVKEEQIDILLHPQSVVHSMVMYKDGSVLAQMGMPDMRTPISYALAWPNRMKTPTKTLDLSKFSELTFKKPDLKRFRALVLARHALKMGGAMPTILNAANEVAVKCFLENRIGFLDITNVIEEVLNEIPNIALTQLDEIINCDLKARKKAEKIAYTLT
ncbi:MAG: 1-deoxy-D-xylulose-5-phosphate reductoisomerase [Pseudomonadota bacterium]|nr:1-deoxy-D-xylulose-5-phosphate reductoisomerase [Pseudomonadota bacterium]